MSENKSWIEWFRFITPVLITIVLFYVKDINTTTHNVDEKLFKHLTNDEIHTPKSIVCTKAEFQIYQEMRQRQMDDLRIGINSRIDNLRESVDKLIGFVNERRNK